MLVYHAQALVKRLCPSPDRVPAVHAYPRHERSVIGGDHIAGEIFERST